MKMKYTEQAVETLDDAGSVIANKNIEIDTIRQRVADLEKDRDSAYKIADHYRTERDKAMQYWQIAEGRCDALKQQRDELVAALYVITKRPVIEAFSIAEEAIASVKEKQNAAD